ncbi:MAG TPA: helix-turn-helix transcriptional regulator [Flavobacteriales bacterium]|nr:helix-turn-helix transcriptional regulator [Flavobacteriales bacterium]
MPTAPASSRTLTIRNMVCDRCRAAVRRVFEDLGASVLRVDLGEVALDRDLDGGERDRLARALSELGFELVEDRDAAIINRIKTAIVALVHHQGDADGRVKLSEHLVSIVHKDYSSLSALFSEVEGVTIEQYFLLQRLERVKELIKYGEHTMSEIADRTGFSSVAHLSAQFKKLTGMTPSAFKAMGGGRLPLDKVG